MAGYGKVFDTFWTEETGRLLRQAGRDYQLTALFLVTAPCRNMIGLFRLPVSIIAHHLNWTPGNALHALRIVCQTGFCQYDEEAEEVWIPEYAKWQIGEPLVAGDKRIGGIVKLWTQKRGSAFYGAFHDRYGTSFHLPSPLEGASQPAKSQQQQQKQQQKQQQQQRQTPEPDERDGLAESKALAAGAVEVVDLGLVGLLVNRGIVTKRAKAAVGRMDHALIREILTFYDRESAAGVFNTPVAALKSMLDDPEDKWGFERTEAGWKPPAGSGKRPKRIRPSTEEISRRQLQTRQQTEAERATAVPLTELRRKVAESFRLPPKG